jgi:hypothetical protein
MIAPPVNDEDCLEPISDVVQQVIDSNDPAVLALVQQHPTTEAFAEYIRSLPQRDDLGHPHDGPKVRACRPPQRLRIPAPDPNCVERSALWLVGAEILDPRPVRQLVTIETPWGMHTMPAEQNQAVILDPQLPRNAVCGALFAAFPARFPMTISDGIDWLTTIAVRRAHVDGTLGRIYNAREAMHSILARYVVPPQDLDDVSYTLQLAREEAPRWGTRSPALVEEIIAVLGSRVPRRVHADETSRCPDLETRHQSRERTAMCGQRAGELDSLRNLSLRIGGMNLAPDRALLGALAKIGIRYGAAAAAPVVMAKLGIPIAALGIIEGELNREGKSLGSVFGSAAKPLFPSLGTLPSIRNASPTVPLGILASRNIAGPSETLTELRITDKDIKALGQDIYLAFRRPFEQQKEAAEARFQQETGRVPGVGKPGVGGFESQAGDYAKVYSYMTPVPTPADIQWQSYLGNFVHSWGEFARGWEQYLDEHDGWLSRLPGTGSYDQALDFRRQAKDWRTQFEALGGVTYSPTPTPPEKPKDALDRAADQVGKAAKTGLIALAVVTGAALVLPPLLRRGTSRT